MSNQDQNQNQSQNLTSAPNLTQTEPPVQSGFQSQPVSTPGGKEMEMQPVSEPAIEEVKEYDIPKEVASHIQKTSETIELPPDLTKIGVQIPPAQASALPQSKGAVLPLTDDQIGAGLNADVKTSLRWLSEWCLKRLKKMHVHLKKIGEHFTREKYAK